jgi:hypothetical protein
MISNPQWEPAALDLISEREKLLLIAVLDAHLQTLEEPVQNGGSHFYLTAPGVENEVNYSCPTN